jgi:hypothetical protein
MGCVPTPSVSDHAVLRYLERAYGLDVAAVRSEMSAGLPAAIDFGASVVICHGVRLIIRDGCVVTVLPRRGKPPTIVNRSRGV